jgi:hypothetical protein
MKTDFSVFMKKIVPTIDHNRIWFGEAAPAITLEKYDEWHGGSDEERYLIEVTFPDGGSGITLGAWIMHDKYDDDSDYSTLSLTIISNKGFRTIELDDFIEFVQSKWQEDGDYDEPSPIDEDPIATEVVVY